MESIASPTYTEKQVKKNGKTSDIISAIMDAYNRDYGQLEEFVRKIRGSDSIERKCRYVFDFIINHIEYKEDPSGKQWIKTPARMFADKVGDCKSMAIFVGSALRCMGIPHLFRFAAYGNSDEPTHVYVVAIDGKREIIVDPVVRVDGKPAFDYEENYTYKRDIMGGTDIYYLAGIGQAKDADEIWSGNNPNRLMDADESSLYINIWLMQRMLDDADKRYGQNSSQAQAILDRIDLALAACYGFENYSGAELDKYLSMLASMANEGMFNLNTTDEKQREAHYGSNLEFAAANFGKYDTQPGVREWIKDQTGEGIYKDEIKSFGWAYQDDQISGRRSDFGIWLRENNGVAGIGAPSNTQIQQAKNEIKNTIEYYACTLIPKADEAQYPASALEKKAFQGKILENWNKAGILTLEDSGKVILSELNRKYSVNAAGFLKLLRERKIQIAGIGSLIAIGAFIANLNGILSTIFGWFDKIINFFKPSTQQLKDNVTNSSDLPDYKSSSSSSSSSAGSGTLMANIQSLALPVGIGALALIFFLNMGKKKK
jgi:hypothetical protein